MGEKRRCLAGTGHWGETGVVVHVPVAVAIAVVLQVVGAKRAQTL